MAKETVEAPTVESVDQPKPNFAEKSLKWFGKHKSAVKIALAFVAGMLTQAGLSNLDLKAALAEAEADMIEETVEEESDES